MCAYRSLEGEGERPPLSIAPFGNGHKTRIAALGHNARLQGLTTGPMVMNAVKTASVALALATAGNALALGLGEAVGQAVLGQPLRIEIPLLGSSGTPPAPECFRVRTPVAETSSEFVLRNARVQVVGERGSSKLIVTSSSIVREPLVAFAVAAGCGFELTKDYMLLTALAAEVPPAPVTLPQPAPATAPPAAAPSSAPVATPAVAASPRPAAAPATAAKASAPPPNDKVLRIAGDISLEALAREKYPAQPKAREKFMRMMARANPGLSNDESIVAAGTELQIPPGLPQRRVGPYTDEAKATTKEEPAAAAVAAPAAPAAAPATPAAAARPAPKPAKGKDRLVLGVGTETNEARLLAEAERLTAMLMEQTKTQDTLTDSIAKMERDYADLQKRFAQIENRVVRIEAERLAEKQAPKPASFDFMELLFAVLAGGGVGGLVLFGVQRWQQRRSPAVDAFTPEAMMATTAPAAIDNELPWSPAPAPAAAADVAAQAAAAASLQQALAVAAPVVVVAPQAAAAEATTAAAAPILESANPDALSLEFSLPPPPAETTPELAATTPAPPAPPPPQIEEPAAAELLSLDFPPIPAAGNADATSTPAPAPLPDIGGSSAPSLEPLSLDFPPIPGLGETKAENPHVVEFDAAPPGKDGAAENALDFHKS